MPRKTLAEGTRVRALKEATSLLQEYGFEGFSFQHVADQIGIKKPSLYEHFKSKEELGIEVLLANLEHFSKWTQTVRVFEPKDQIGALFELSFEFSCQSRKLCPLSAAAGNFNSISPNMRKAVEKFYAFEFEWLEGRISDGQKKKIFRRDLTSGELAKVVLSIVLGAQVIARVTRDPSHVRRMKEQAFSLLEGPGSCTR